MQKGKSARQSSGPSLSGSMRGGSTLFRSGSLQGRAIGRGFGTPQRKVNDERSKRVGVDALGGATPGRIEVIQEECEHEDAAPSLTDQIDEDMRSLLEPSNKVDSPDVSDVGDTMSV